MKNILYILFIFATTHMLSNCSSGGKDILAKEKLKNILEDIHLTDAMLRQKKTIQGDSISMGSYEYIYKKHNISKEYFERSMKYYSARPEVLHTVYNDIINSLSIKDSILKKKIEMYVDTVQLWDGKKSYTLEKYSKSTLPVDIPVKYQQKYYISADIKLYKDSHLKKVSPRFTFVAPDTTYVLPTYTSIYTDTVFKSFKMEQVVTDSTVTALKGDFLHSGKNDSIVQFKHFEVKNIKIYTIVVDSTANKIKIDSLTTVK